MLICKRFHYEQAEKTLLRLGQGPIFLSKPKARSILDTRNLALRIFGNPENFSSSLQLPSCQLWTYLPKQLRCNCIIPSPMAPSLLRKTAFYPDLDTMWKIPEAQLWTPQAENHTICDGGRSRHFWSTERQISFVVLEKRKLDSWNKTDTIKDVSKSQRGCLAANPTWFVSNDVSSTDFPSSWYCYCAPGLVKLMGSIYLKHVGQARSSRRGETMKTCFKTTYF